VLGLTSLPLVFLLAGLTAALLGGVVWGWPRLASRGGRQFALRLVALCALQASMLSLALVLVNRSGQFYSSWSDLLGRYKGGGTLVSVHESSVRQSALLSVLAQAPVTIPGRPGDAGVLQTVAIRGALSGLRLRGHVYLPPGYPRSGRGGQGYPVVVAVSRYQDSRGSPYGAPRLAQAAAIEIAAHRIQPLIVLTLPPGPRSDPSCLDVPRRAQAATFFTQDLSSVLSSGYRVSTQPGSWALLADASGGYCALQLALTNAQAFSAVAAPAGAYQSPPGPPLWGNSPQLRAQDNLPWLLGHQPMQPISVLFTGPGTALPFLALVHPPMHVTTTSLGHGRWPLMPVLGWLSRILSQPVRSHDRAGPAR